MNKIFNFIKKNILGFLLGIIFCSITIVIAESIQSSEVLYDNSNSRTEFDNVQDVLDDVYNIVGTVGSGHELIAHTPAGLSTELIGGLYRYQGIQDDYNNVDNYICFGTTNKNTCVGDTRKYMYRIIGINSNGQMKLLKKDALSTGYQWNSTKGADWAHSDLYNGLNSSYFLDNTYYIPDNLWKNKIVNTDWYYATLTDGTISAANMYSLETSASTVTAKVGLLYLHDYYYGLAGGNSCTSSPSVCKTSWIHLSKNDEYVTNSIEWLITRYSNDNPWGIFSSGQSYTINNMTSSNYLRPVFFLNASETIASGNGTLADPYILS